MKDEEMMATDADAATAGADGWQTVAPEEERTMDTEIPEGFLEEIERQIQVLEGQFPGFDLRREMENPRFRHLIGPGAGLSMEEAFHVLHRRQIQRAMVAAMTQNAMQKVTQAIQAGSRRPSEHGTSGQAPSVTGFDYSRASQQQRMALKDAIRQAAARGEKIYPR